MNSAKIYQYRLGWIYLPMTLLALVIFFALSSWLLPLPPEEITISSGRPGGMYQENAKAYKLALKDRGVTLNILESAGTGENLQRLKDPSNAVHVAFAQGGYAFDEGFDPDRDRIQTLAQVDIEPIWVFSRFRELDSLLQLQGLRVALGEPGSGSRAVALSLLGQLRLEAKDFAQSSASGLSTVTQLRDGSLDATIFVASVNAPLVQALLNTPGVYLAPLKRSAALSERMPYLEARFAAQGSLNASRSQPPQDMALISTVASVLVREDLHPMLKRLLTQVMLDQHSSAGPLHRAHEFPHLKRLEYPSAAQARQVLREGLPWLERHTTVQTAQWLYRLLLLGLPIALFCLFLGQLIPRYLMWRIDSRINRWYGELKYIENDLNHSEPRGLELSNFHTRLRQIAKQASDFPMPRAYMQRMFTLQQHIDLVGSMMQARLGR
jgi:uncharacterized protein